MDELRCRGQRPGARHRRHRNRPDHFLRTVVESNQSGVESLFINPSGAMQASRDETLIDFHSSTKSKSSNKTFLQLIDTAEDRVTVR